MTTGGILIVDDEPGFVAGLRVVLENRGYKVAAAENRVQAERIAQSETVDIVVLGTIAPRGDAFLFHQWLRRNRLLKHLPMIVVDAPAEKQLLRGWSRDEGMQLDADDYLVKPIKPESLVSRIEPALERARVSAVSTANQAIRVLLADDHAMIREGIRALLATQSDIQVVGEAVDGEDALEKARALSPDVVVMDIGMPVMNGIEATERICRECERTRVLMLTQYNGEENLAASRQAGAFGYIPKACASSQLLAAIRAVSRGQLLMQRFGV